jgi:hypothetical protein
VIGCNANHTVDFLLRRFRNDFYFLLNVQETKGTNIEEMYVFLLHNHFVTSFW